MAVDSFSVKVCSPLPLLLIFQVRNSKLSDLWVKLQSRHSLKNSITDHFSQGYFSIAMSTVVLVRALKVALFVGTILAFINHGEKILTLSLTGQDWFKVLLTYLVPYCVSTWSAVAVIKANAVTEQKL